jgi:hypothetical protein
MIDDKASTLIKLVEGEDLWLQETVTEVLEGPVASRVQTVFGLELPQIADDEK